MPCQKRVMFFSFDRGTGVGHLRRLATIARAMQGPAACLIVTSHREAADLLVPQECEYLRLPGWDGLIPERAAHWSRKPFLETDRSGARSLRVHILRGAVDGFRPDAIVVDHIPLGGEQELEDVLAATACRKYLITRGVQNETEDLASLILGGKAKDALERTYDAILAAVDPAVFDFAAAHDLGPKIRSKTAHVGYISDPIEAADIERARRLRGATARRPWIVASAGGGQNGERLIRSCLDLPPRLESVLFDIVFGPRSNLRVEEFAGLAAQDPRIRLHAAARDLPLMNASADLVITGGGYNTLVETLRGQADIVCVPLRPSHSDEQFKNARLLSRFAAIEVASDPSGLEALVRTSLARRTGRLVPDRRATLDFGGAAAVARRIMADLQVPAARAEEGAYGA